MKKSGKMMDMCMGSIGGMEMKKSPAPKERSFAKAVRERRAKHGRK